MKHRVKMYASVPRGGSSPRLHWFARCECGWEGEKFPVTQGIPEGGMFGLGSSALALARADGRAHELDPEPIDWSIIEGWLKR